MTRCSPRRLGCRALLVLGLVACSAPPRQARQGNPIEPEQPVIDSGAPVGFDASVPVPMLDASLAQDAGEDAAEPAPEPIVIDECGADNPAQLDAQEIAQLTSATSPAGLRILYPYDGTVFPRGLAAPLVMWDGVAGSAAYVHLSASLFDYKGCLPISTAGRLELPEAAWTAAQSRAGGPSDPFTLELSVLDSGAAHGVLQQKLVIAQGSLKGSIYYNSYSSPLATAAGAPGGAVLRIRSGGAAELFAGQQNCTGCHSLSANGERLLAQANPSDATGTVGGSVWKIDPQTPLDPPALRTNAVGVEFAGVFPDGSLYLETAHSNGAGVFMSPTYTGAINDMAFATLYETDSGKVIDESGIPPTALLPTFSPSGKLLTFNNGAYYSGASLSVMSFDVATRKAGDERFVYQDGSGKIPGWPFVLPDDQAVIFALGNSSDFSSGGASASGHGSDSELWIADISASKSVMLARAMGYTSAAATATYLPFPGDDERQAFFPTVSPVQAGGYFWVFFDSVRHYGNQGMQRQLWGFAVDVRSDGDYTSDPSHPAFYLAGQELGTSNHRAFTALDPCKVDAQACETGIDCCGGFCTDGVCAAPPPETPRCSRTDEACETREDCCDAQALCIGGYCGPIVVE